MNVRIRQPCTRSLKGHVVSLGFVVVMRKKQSKQSVASCMFANLFSLHEVNFDQCGNVKMTVNIPKGTEL